MSVVHWDGSISLGNLVTIGVFIFTLYSFHIKNVQRFTRIEVKVNTMWGQLKHRLNIISDEDEDS